jgi:hypothetical protein
MGMKRIVILLLSVLALALTPTIGFSQGLFGGIPGLPSFGGFLGGPGACGEKSCAPAPGPTFYVGWMEDRDGTSFTANSDVALGGVLSLEHGYANRGLWLGLGQVVPIKDRFAFLASGWYLIPSNDNSREIYTGIVGERTWDTETQWWFVDGLFAVGAPGGFSILAGLRYDYFTTTFKNPRNVVGIPGLPTDQADVITQNWIPLVGTQMSYAGSFGNLTVRAVGVPTLVGNVRYKQTLGAAASRIEAKGNYNSGYFLEFFGEYSKSFGSAGVGIFGRWNMAEGEAKLSTDLIGLGGSQDFDLALHRNSWTLGGSFSLAFNMPGIPGM